MKNMYFVSYNPAVTLPTTFHAAIQGSKLISSWWHYLPATYLLATPSTTTATMIQDELRKSMPTQRFIVMKVDPKSFGGWLPNEAWDWIFEQRKSV